MSERLPLGIPFGWFCVGYSDELAPGELRSLRYFGRDLVLFRTEAGIAALVDAHCPHLGAHLGMGGCVTGEAIRCPFHHWSFDTAGRCVDIPYAKRIPAAARDGALRSYPLVERNEILWAWYHPDDAQPFFEVDVHTEVGDPDWVPLDRYAWTFDSHPQEIAENGVDVAHFRYVHSLDAVPEGETSYEGVRRTSFVEGQRTFADPDGVMRTIDSTVLTVQNGAGQKWSRLTGLTETLLMTLVTPVDSDRCDLRFAFTRRNFPKGSFEERTAVDSIESIRSGVEDDIVIWENKIFRPTPVLCDGDGPIPRYRRYFAQFYAPVTAPETRAVNIDATG